MGKINYKNLAISLAVSLGSGLIGWFLTRDSMAQYMNMYRPPLAPPGWLFPVVWTVLFILMGIAAYLVYETGDAGREDALTVYVCQLLVNIGWSLFFFGFNSYWFSFVWLLVLWVLIFVNIRQFSAISLVAGRLLIPYIIWVTFAGYLNFSIALHG